MNRRGFLTAMATAPVAAVMAPAATPFVSTFPYGASLSCGVPSVGIVDFGQSLYVGDADFSNVKYAIAEIEALMTAREREACDAIVGCMVEADHQDELDEVPA